MWILGPGPYIGNFTLWFYEFNFISSLYKKDYRRTLALRNTFRLIDDISNLNSDEVFQELTREIYPSSLILNKENVNDNEADILDLNISLKDGKFICSVYNKRDKFQFSVVRVRILFLFNLFVSLGFDPCKLIKTFTNCINRHKFSEKFKTIGHILSPISI